METASSPESSGASPRKRVLITGASGYIGRRLVTAVRVAGHEVVAAVRDVRTFASTDGLSARAFDLAAPEALACDFPQVDAVVHLAALIKENSLPAGVAEDINVSGTRRLLEASRLAGVRRFVFVSSQSAAKDAPSRYGRSKWAIERLLTGPGEVVVRPGMVSGGPPRGLYGLLYRLCRAFPILPLVAGSAPVYPVHLDDLCDGIIDILGDTRSGASVRFIAPGEPQRFADYIRMIAAQRVGRRVRLVPVPAALALFASRLTERISWLPTVASERVVGLLALSSYSIEDTSAAPQRLRDLRMSLAREGRKRRLIAEGRALMRYVLGGPVPPGAVRRYVRAVLGDERSEPLGLSPLALAWPRGLRAVEPLSPAPLLKRRLSLATRIVEMTPAGAQRFHGYAGRPLPLAFLSVAASLALETLLLPVRYIAAWIIRRP